MLLSGIRVVEVATYIAAPASAAILSDFGADVIKVERLPDGDPYRTLYKMGAMPISEHNYSMILDARNKRSISLDLADDAGRDALLRLVADADIFITNCQFAVLDKLRLNYEQIKHPRLIYAHVTGYGDTGPDIARPGYDMTAYWARSGLMNSVHAASSDPALSVPGMGDHPTSVALFASIMMALFRREKTGEGGRVTTSLLANGAWSNACVLQAVLVGATGIRHRDRWENNILANHFLARDGQRFVLCGVQASMDWPRLCRVIGRPELEQDPRFSTGDARMENGKVLTTICDDEFSKLDMEDWRQRLKEEHLAWGPVQTVHDVAADPQMRAANVIVPLDDPALPGVETIASPIHLDGEQKRAPSAAPAPGQHTEEILKQAGYSDEQISDLISRGIAGTHKA